MKTLDDKLSQFREEADTVLGGLRADAVLQQKVLDRLEEKPRLLPARRRWVRAVAAFVVALALLGGVWQIPSVQAAMIPPLAQVIAWIGESTNLPVKVPQQWNQVIVAPQKQQVLSPYYFEATRSADSYQINVYRLNQPIAFQNYDEMLEKNGPLSESQMVGSISGDRVRADMQPLSMEIPSGSIPFELAPGITAHEADGGVSVYWKQGGWSFQFVGSSLSRDALAKLASAWSDDIAPADAGLVQLYEGNRLNHAIQWEENGVRYKYQTTSTDYQELADILKHFKSWEQKERGGA